MDRSTEQSGITVGPDRADFSGTWLLKPSAWLISINSPSAVLEIICSVLATLGNGVVVFTILRPRNQDRLRTPLNLLILQLAVPDLLVGSVAEPMTIYAYVKGIYNSVSCVFYLLLGMTLGKASILGFALISIERFLAIRFPYKHGRFFSQKSVLLLSVGVWTCSLIYALVPTVLGMMGNWDERIGCVFTRIVPLSYMVIITFVGMYTLEGLVIIAIYTYLFFVVRRQLNRIASLQVPQQPEANIQNGSHLRRELKAAFRCFLIIAVYVTFQWPLHIRNILEWSGMYISADTIMWLVWLRRVNSAINPFCYAFTAKSLRRELYRLLPCCCKHVGEGFETQMTHTSQRSDL